MQALAKRDLLKQAEVLEEAFSDFDARGLYGAELLRYQAKELREKALSIPTPVA